MLLGKARGLARALAPAMLLVPIGCWGWLPPRCRQRMGMAGDRWGRMWMDGDGWGRVPGRHRWISPLLPTATFHPCAKGERKKTR